MDTSQRLVVFLAGFYINTFVFAILFAFGSFFNDILDKYNETTAETAAVQAIFIGVGLSSGIISGVLIARYGLWKVSVSGAIFISLGFILSFFATTIIHLYICISMLAGFGVSMLFIAGTTAVQKTFLSRKRLLFLALQNSGASLGVAVLPYLFDFLTATYGLNGTFLLMGGFYLNCLPISIIFYSIKHHSLNQKKNPYPENQNASPKRNMYYIFKAEIFKTGKRLKESLTLPFAVSVISIGIVMGSLNGYFALVLDILKQKGLSSGQALLGFPISYGIGFFARLCPGLVKQVKGVSCFVVPIFLCICGMVGQILMIHSTVVWVILLGCGLSGLTISGVASSASIIAVQLVDNDNVSVGLGLAHSCIGILTAVAGPVYGAIKDTTKTYDNVQYITAGLQVAGLLLFVLVMIIRKRGTSHLSHSSKSIDNYAFSDV